MTKDQEAGRVLEQQSKRILSAPMDNATLPTLNQLSELTRRNQCHGLTSKALLAFVDLLTESPVQQKRRDDLGQIFLIKAKLHQQQGETRRSAESLQQSFQLRPQFRTAILESVEWSKINELDKALSAVKKARQHQARKAGMAYTTPPDLIKWESHLRELKNNQKQRAVPAMPTK